MAFEILIITENVMVTVQMIHQIIVNPNSCLMDFECNTTNFSVTGVYVVTTTAQRVSLAAHPAVPVRRTHLYIL